MRTCLGLGVIFRLGFWWNDGPSLICVHQITLIVTYHTRRACIDKRLHPRFLTCLNHTFRPLHINFLIHRLTAPNQRWRCCMNHDIWHYLLEDGEEGGN